MSRSSKRLARRTGSGVQYAALPYTVDGGVKGLLITSRETRRWVIPKGWPMKRLSASHAAAREALEEAGVSGEVAPEAAGAYRYVKRMRDGATIACLVQVFPLRVTEEHAHWPEEIQRERAWFTPGEAAARVAEPELKALLRAFDPARG